MKDKPGFWAVIPASVRYSDLKPNAKLLYGEITALQNKEGYCFAQNKYFARLYNVTKNTASSWINDLAKAGFIEIEIIKDGGEVKERRITLTKKEDTPITKKDDYNNTSYNITNNNILLREQNFQNAIDLLDYDDNIKKEFFEYWKEKNKSKTKMRFELEKTWDLNLRLQRWSRRQNQWNKNNPGGLKQKLNTFNKAQEMLNKINNQ
tara:strand:- start:2214 stop:2834 length:621 start_codon:yes stop_codon:yes gene_type:complete